jgi:DNA-directed RNA polymerase specialized sigma24 family protein
MNDRQLLELAQKTLTADEYRVWFAKHYQGYGRRAGSLALGVTEDQFRNRLHTATRKLRKALEEAA